MGYAARTPRVLLASEDQPFLRALRVLLGDIGLDVSFTSDWSSLPRKVASLPANLVILDFGVAHAEQTALALLALRKELLGATVPVIATAPAVWLLEERADLLTRCRAHVMRDPCDLGALLRAVEEALLPRASAVAGATG